MRRGTRRVEDRWAKARSGFGIVMGLAVAAPGATPSPSSDALPGVVQTILGPDDQGLDRRVLRQPEFFVAADDPATPFVPAGSFRCRIDGGLSVRFLDDYEFRAFGRGRVRVEVGGELVLEGELSEAEPLASKLCELDRGVQPFSVRYSSPTGGDAILRLEWSSFDFDFRPIPPSAWSHAADAHPPMLERVARESLTRRRCVHCHALEQELDARECAPELSWRAPSLVGAASRWHPAWLERWLDDPAAVQSTTAMPRLDFGGEAADRRARIRDVVAFLARNPPGPSSAPAGDAEAGAAQFESLGCFNCHELGEESQEDEFGVRLSLDPVPGKWREQALVEFLLDPHASAPGIGMPNFALSPKEARDLAAFLNANGPAAPQWDASGADAARGEVLLREVGCLACHEGPGEDPGGRPSFATILSAGARGCLAETSGETPGPVRYPWEPGEREALVSFLASAATAAQRDEPIDYAARAARQYRCGSCHDRDGVLSGWARLRPEPEYDPLAEPAEEEVSQKRPGLSFAGEGLRPEWLAPLFRGEQAPSRPWLHARMPAFAVDAERLAAGLAAEHGLPPRSEPPGAPDLELAEIGAKLLQQNGGLGCIQCHDQGKVEAAGVFDAQGPDFSGVPGRLRWPYFQRLLNEPRSVLGSTKMPAFVEDGETAITEYFGGDAARQFEALWHQMLRQAEEAREGSR